MNRQVEEMKRLLAIHRAKESMKAVIEKAAGPCAGPHESLTYLATSIKVRDGLPATACIRKMSDTVAKNLAALGLHEPVSLRLLPGKWWKAHVDAADVGLAMEYGCGYVVRYLRTESLDAQGVVEVAEGPFDTQDDASHVMDLR